MIWGSLLAVTGASDTALAGTRPYITHMYEANFWISFGYTRSQLHYDKVQQQSQVTAAPPHPHVYCIRRTT